MWTKGESTTQDYRYAYDREGNLVSSFDMTESREYNYAYENGELSKVRVWKLINEHENDKKERIILSFFKALANLQFLPDGVSFLFLHSLPCGRIRADGGLNGR